MLEKAQVFLPQLHKVYNINSLVKAMSSYTDRRQRVLNLLLKGTNTFFLTECLNYNFTISAQYPRNRESIERNISRYNKKIERFFKDKKKTISPIEPFQTNYRQRAEKASLYFQQALELYRTSLSMPRNTRPLVEYYSLLQAVKGSIILELDFTKEYVFEHHGLTADYNDETVYIRAKVKKQGVFPALLLRFSRVYDHGEDCENNRFEYSMDEYFNNKFTPSLEELFENLLNSYNVNLPKTFIASWMISLLVRYKPELWHDLLSGKHDKMSIYLQQFHYIKIPEAFNSLLIDYGGNYLTPQF
ncbi:MAG: hypothetical protein HeimAB125_01170 [Candidatus Heimdallarchaeota archaeon AB_125]|nr:MAG: hypothetical protein HeimAB125_01170 [Candidatus Heimdallarchaeota archaeon AB_125]